MPDPTLFELSPRRALSALSADDQATWHLRYCPQEGLEMRARLVLETVERQMREAGREVTIHALWVELTDRAGQGGEPDVRGWRWGCGRGKAPVCRGAAARVVPLRNPSHALSTPD